MSDIDDIDTIWRVFSFFVGACIGSFLNVCAYRIPKNKSIAFPRSTCECGKPIPWYNNIPILSWLLLRGRARCCGMKLSPGHIIVETLMGVIFFLLWRVYGEKSVIHFIIAAAFSSVLVLVAIIDFDTMEIYEIFPIIGLFLGLVCAGFVPEWILGSSYFEISAYEALKKSLSGAFIGSGVMVWLSILGEFILKKEAVGFGDVELMGMIGAFTGTEGSIFAIFGGAVIGSMIFFSILFFLKLTKKGNVTKSGAVPFIPFLAAGSITYILYGPKILEVLFPQI